VSRRTWLPLLLLLGLSVVAQDRTNQIELGANLKLGMPQAEALTEVGKHFETKAMEDGSHFVVFIKPASGEKPKWEGILTFKAAKLVAVERLWAYDDDERSVAMAKSLFGALTSVVKSGTSTCKVEDQISDVPDAQGETVYLNCGKRSIKISVAKVAGYREDASVSELLEQ
jgi:hypothetical protein